MCDHLSVDLTEPLYDAIRGFSIPRISDPIIAEGRPLEVYQTEFFQLFHFEFLPALFSFLKKLVCTLFSARHHFRWAGGD